MNVRLKVIIALMSAALLGLICIQFYWIDNAIVLKKDEFNQKVIQAMKNVSGKLERKEAIENLRRHQLGRQLIHEQMKKRKQFLKSHRPKKNNNDYTNGEGRFDGEWTMTKLYTKDSSTQIIRKEYIGTGNSSFEVDVNIKGDKLPVEIEFSDLDGDSQIIEERWVQKSAFIDDVITDLMEFDRFKSIEERIDLSELDSMLKNELKSFMINTEVEVGIFDYFGDLITSNSYETEKALRKSIYKGRLFPNDFFGEPVLMSLYFPNQKEYLLKSMWITLGVSTLFLLLIVGAFSYTLHIIQNQKQLSLIKNDFISNMTHELKTPISTISLACEALSDATISKDTEKKSRFLNMISQENSRLAILVENVLKSSIWDRADFKLKHEQIDLHEIIRETCESMKILVEQKNGKLELNLLAESHTLTGDKVHLTNIFYNLLDNAIKYSNEIPEITINTSSTKNNIIIDVKDNGIGIPKDQNKKIFEKFYRIPTGNIHNVKGFGLGLNYVYNVIRNHGGDISVLSNQGKGSCFQLTFPLNRA